MVWSKSKGFSSHIIYRIAPFNDVFATEILNLNERIMEFGKVRKTQINNIMLAMSKEGKPRKNKDLVIKENIRKFIITEIIRLTNNDKLIKSERMHILDRPKDFCDE